MVSDRVRYIHRLRVSDTTIEHSEQPKIDFFDKIHCLISYLYLYLLVIVLKEFAINMTNKINRRLKQIRQFFKIKF